MKVFGYFFQFFFWQPCRILWTTGGLRITSCKTLVQEPWDMEGGEVSEKRITDVEKYLNKLQYTEYKG